MTTINELNLRIYVSDEEDLMMEVKEWKNSPEQSRDTTSPVEVVAACFFKLVEETDLFAEVMKRLRQENINEK